MSERGDQIQKLLGSLFRHADLIAEAFEGTVTGGDRQRNAAIETLFGFGVFKPYDEGAYRLNPRLREFLSEYFASYHAFQALRQVTGTMKQAQEQWKELRRLKSIGATKDATRLFAAFDDSIVEMAYSIEHNLGMLHALLATQYGNVDDLTSKLKQNLYYAQQVRQFLRDVQGIDAFVEEIAEEAIISAIPEVRKLVTRHLGARLLYWTAQIKDAQDLISKRLFEARLMEQNLKRLSRFALWLNRHRTVDGWETEVDVMANPALFRFEGIHLRPQPDIADADPVVMEGMLAAVAKLPSRKPSSVPVKDDAPQLLIEDEGDEVVEQSDPVLRSLQELLHAVLRSDSGISLLEWKRSHQELAGIGEDAWCMFSCKQLQTCGLRLHFMEQFEPDPFAINEPFYDVQVHRPLAETR